MWQVLSPCVTYGDDVAFDISRSKRQLVCDGNFYKGMKLYKSHMINILHVHGLLCYIQIHQTNWTVHTIR